MSESPPTHGTVTLLFTDIEGSTRLLEQLGDTYAEVLRAHHRIMDAVAVENGGSRVDAAGDGLFYSFGSARGGLAAAVEAQHRLTAQRWPDEAIVRVRMGLHSGEPLTSETGFVGIDVHRAARICSAGHGGQVLVSDAVRTLVGSTLPTGVTLRDLGTHSLRGLHRPEHLFQVNIPGLPTAFPPLRSLDLVPNNLPRQLTSFVGRDLELAEAAQRLRTASVLTLTGPGGVGKTRLALEIAARVAHDFEGGTWLVDLSAMTDGDGVTEAFASTLSVKQRAGQPLLDAVVDAMSEKPMLLVVDNCEHVLDAVVISVEEILRRDARLKLLATSREALGMAGESLMPVPSMSLPASEELEALASCEAVRLFVERARAVHADFALDHESAGAIAQICRRLDGIPLAIELAAARIRSLPATQIAARLDDRFRLLSGGSRTALPRHRTLRAAFDWSYDLLTPAEKTLLARLSVFAGSFSLEAAEAVCDGWPVEGDAMLDLLERLIDRSLLAREPERAEARYRMLESIREYAQERLTSSGEAPDLRLRHRDWCANLVELARPAFFSGAVQPEWIARLATDHDNLLAALRWADEDPDGADAELSMASGLWRFWDVHGDLREGSTWLERALQRVGGEVSPRRANALTGAGILAARRGNYAEAAAFHDASLMLYRELGDPLAIATACSNCASLAVERGDLERARTLYSESVEITRQAGTLQAVGFSLINLADVATRQGAHEEAERLYTESIAAFEELGDTWGKAHATSKLGQAARRRGDNVAARTHLSEAIAMHEETGDRHGTARLSASLGDLAAEDGDVREAERLYQQALAIRGELGDRVGVATILERLAGVTEDRPLRAAVLLGAADALREATGARLTVASSAMVDRFIDGLSEHADPATVRAALAEGRRLSWDAILRRAEGRD